MRRRGDARRIWFALPGRLREWQTAFARIEAAYAKAHGRKPNLLRPRRFTEKMQWRKLFGRNPVYPILCDKMAVRDFIASRGGEAYLVPLLWTGLPAEIPFEQITPPFVLKSTHASGQVIMMADGEPVDPAGLRRRGESWLAVNYGIENDEPGYSPVRPRLMIERTVTAEDGTRPDERRLFVFDGKVTVINTVFVEDGRIRNGAFHTPDWRNLNWHFTRTVDRAFPEPARLAEMISLAERLGAGLDQVRVDIYDGGAHIWIGELTLYSWSGLSRFDPDAADFELGAFWHLRAPVFRAITALLHRRTGTAAFGRTQP